MSTLVEEEPQVQSNQVEEPGTGQGLLEEKVGKPSSYADTTNNQIDSGSTNVSNPEVNIERPSFFPAEQLEE